MESALSLDDFKAVGGQFEDAGLQDFLFDVFGGELNSGSGVLFIVALNEDLKVPLQENGLQDKAYIFDIVSLG